MTPIGSLGIAFLSSALCLYALLRYLPSLAVDVANERSLHVGVIPRFGGLGVVAGTVAATAWGGVSLFWFGPWLLLAAISFADDRWHLPIALRLCLHLLAAGASLSVLGLHGNFLVAAIVLLLWAWHINLFNFMDGSDGLAGAMAIVVFLGLAWAAGVAGRPDLGGVALASAGAVAGFLMFNLPPARVFLGDVGSISIGFLSAALAVAGWVGDAWPAWFPVFLCLPFWTDASLTLARRILAGEAFWRPHREHAYQRLVQMGWSHGRLLAAAVLLMVLDAATACLALALGPGAAATVLSFCLLANVALWVGINLRWQRFEHCIST